MLCVALRPLNGPPAVIRTDQAPGFQALSQVCIFGHVFQIFRPTNLALGQNKIMSVSSDPPDPNFMIRP